MSLYDYRASLKIAAEDLPFYALIMAAIRKADSTNMVLLERAWPDIVAEFWRRYNAPGGVLPGETTHSEEPSDGFRF